MYTFIDIETTGFSRTEDEIISFAYILTGTDFKTIIDTGVRYLYQEGQKNSSPGAYEVHGLSNRFLAAYAEEYENNLCKLNKIASCCRLVGHNVDAFDAPFIEAYLNKNGFIYDRLRGESIDTMKAFHSVYGKRKKLTDLCNDYDITPNIISTLQAKLFKGYRIFDRAHDAAYDTTATLLLTVRAKEEGLI
jgi:DNA polymerase III epsilon subunit-like protein